MSYVINVYAKTSNDGLVSFESDATTSNYLAAIEDVREYLTPHLISPVLALIINEIKEVPARTV